MRVLISFLLLSTLLTGNAFSVQTPAKQASGDSDLAKKIRRFSPTELTASTAHLSANDKKALAKIIEAAKLLDPLFLRQVWSGNDALKTRARSRQDSGRQAAAALLPY